MDGYRSIIADGEPISAIAAQLPAEVVARLICEEDRLYYPEADAALVEAADPSDQRARQMRWGADVIQRHLDATAQTRSYDSIHTAVGYRDDPNPAFAAEAAALFAWRSAVWTEGLAIMAAVAAGERALPSEAEIIAELPPMIWPG